MCIRLLPKFPRFSRISALYLLLTALCWSPAFAQTRKTPSPRAGVEEADHASGATRAASGSAPGQPTAPKRETAKHLAALPEPLPKDLTRDIDVKGRSKALLEHLSQVIRYYRMTTTPIQKIGEPSDMLYAEQAETTATQVAQLAFQAARDEAALLARVQSAANQADSSPVEQEAQRLRSEQLRVSQQIADLENASDALSQQLQKAHADSQANLRAQLDQVNGQLELAQAESQALIKVSGVSASQTNSGLQGDIDKLQHAVPEAIDGKVKPIAGSIESVGSIRQAGVVSQAQVLFQLLSTRQAIDERIAQLKQLHQQATEMRTPLVNILRATLDQGRKLQSGAGEQGSQAQGAGGSAAATNSAAPATVKKTYDQLTDAFKTISDVSIPVSQEILVLEQAQGNLISWRAAVDSERASVIHSLLVRVVIIAFILLLVLVAGEMWRRAATRYVQDLRRRRQLLVLRRVVIGFLLGVVIILGFVTQFSSLATFAGLITAGIAVGLQTVLLSVAAYFFIIGRYGVRVGDRITVANVTGEVVDVGLVRFYMMELAGTGAELHPTGRIAVFANSVLFQTGTPLYKQIPGTNYAWHQVAMKLKPGSDYHSAVSKVRNAIERVYAGYKEQIERQQMDTEVWMDASLPRPGIEAKLDFSDGLRFSVLYPVPISQSAAIDQQIVESIVDLVDQDTKMAEAMDGHPELQAVAKT